MRTGQKKDCVELSDSKVACANICDKDFASARNMAIDVLGVASAPAACASTAIVGAEVIENACISKPLNLGKATCIEYIGMCDTFLQVDFPNIVWIKYGVLPSRNQMVAFAEELMNAGICSGSTGKCGEDWTAIPKDYQDWFPSGVYVCQINAKHNQFSKRNGMGGMKWRLKIGGTGSDINTEPCLTKMRAILDTCFDEEKKAGTAVVCKGQCINKNKNGPLRRNQDGKDICEYDKLPGRKLDLCFRDSHCPQFKEGQFLRTQKCVDGPGGKMRCEVLPAEDSAQTCTVTRNAAISGHNKYQMTGRSVLQCNFACDATPWCNSFDYTKSTSTCDLSDKKASDVGLTTSYSGNPYDHYDCPSHDCTKTQDAAISGHNKKWIYGKTVLECKAACNSEHWCKSFDYVKSSSYCALSTKNANDVGGLKTDYAGNPYDYYGCSQSTGLMFR